MAIIWLVRATTASRSQVEGGESLLESWAGSWAGGNFVATVRTYLRLITAADSWKRSKISLPFPPPFFLRSARAESFQQFNRARYERISYSSCSTQRHFWTIDTIP